ncbi:MAG: antibiotic transport system ATP-binding protein [Anaerolineaceae bacterium]|nr:MAG: antibiotic transport system ATP-binding protein [Anaerolineaceae bacterium]
MIQAEDLSKQFGDYWAVDGVHLDVRPGQVLALLGQNGAGKTTTVRMLTSVLLPTRGRASIAGYDVVRQPEQVRALVGVLTEQHGLYLRMTGGEYLDFYGRIYNLDAAARRRRSAELLGYFGLAEAARQRIGEYSKGMRQKLALARTLIHEPPVLLLDEPTSAMDPESARLVRDSIASLRSSNRAIIICTHNLVEAELLADHVAIIRRGRILVSGPVEELKARLLGAPIYEVRMRNGWRGGTLSLPPGVELVTESGTGARFRVADAEASNPVLLQQLMTRGDEIVAMQEVPRTLEEVYLAAMQKVPHD